jgi:hypothetical protein
VQEGSFDSVDGQGDDFNAMAAHHVRQLPDPSHESLAGSFPDWMIPV